MGRKKEPTFEKISEDGRGANYRIVLPDGRELVMIFTRAGCWRGGHYHNVDEVSFMLSGRMQYIKKALIGPADKKHFEDQTFMVSTDQLYANRAGEPHVGHFLEDSWLLDWKSGAKAGKFKTVNYEPYRKLVDDDGN